MIVVGGWEKSGATKKEDTALWNRYGNILTHPLGASSMIQEPHCF